MVLPLMPLPAVYMPSPSQQLIISEPRYRALYDDILLSGSRLFVVTFLQGSRLARVGVVFHLDDLKDISADTNDRMKFCGEHTIRGRVRLHSVVNPEAWEDGSTYLRAEVELLDGALTDALLGCGGEAGFDGEVGAILAGPRQRFQEVLTLHCELGEEPRLELKGRVGALRSRAARGFWELCGAVGALLTSKLELRVAAMQAEVRSLVAEWLRANPDAAQALKKDPNVLPASIRRDGDEARAAFQEGSQQLQGAFQRLLQAAELRERSALLTSLLEEEVRRLRAMRSLKGLFGD